jgi:hypothetical protein
MAAAAQVQARVAVQALAHVLCRTPPAHAVAKGGCRGWNQVAHLYHVS